MQMNFILTLTQVRLSNLHLPPFFKQGKIDPPPTFHNYLDAFLQAIQAIRVFGFLEKPVRFQISRGTCDIDRFDRSSTNLLDTYRQGD